ncbi:MFS transporter [Prauserella cavernicola]|uniref:MFS transporter n=1 Tax=Prauserella cavernicola TaxID=2800127 RepID=A0A934V6N1_9PSEU|nr:MFS transporter [Prauserella cavernicola]MBK1786385.1 MFS transporter [Prauserella cavernicola]
MTAPLAEPRAGAREWCGLALLALPLLVLAFDISVLYLAAPQLTADLAPSATQQLWILDIYGFLIAGFLLTMGALGDRIGRRRLLLGGGAAFAAASVLAAFAPNAELLIAARALLGVTGATMMPSTLALISTMFRDARQRSFAIAIWMTTFSAGVAVGPIVGGIVLEAFWWGAVFLLGVPVMLVLVALGPVLLPEHRDPEGARGIDLPSALLSLATTLPFVYGVKETVAHGAGPVPALAMVAGAGVGVVFVRRQRRFEHPLLDVSLFTRRAFVVAVSLMLLGTLAVNGLMYLIPQYLQLLRGESAFGAALWMTPIAAVSVLASLLAPVLARALGRRVFLATAGATALVSCAALGLTGADTALPLVLALASVAVFGIAPVGVLGTDLVVGSVPPARAGSAAAVSETAAELGVAVGVAVTGSLVAAVYGANLAGTLPTGLPAEVAENARDGVAAALSAAEALPPGLGDRLVEAARTAFAEGFAAAGLLCATVLAGTIALALAIPRERRTDEEKSG